MGPRSCSCSCLGYKYFITNSNIEKINRLLKWPQAKLKIHYVHDMWYMKYG